VAVHFTVLLTLDFIRSYAVIVFIRLAEPHIPVSGIRKKRAEVHSRNLVRPPGFAGRRSHKTVNCFAKIQSN
jgi:hypothetical protein